jgi:hypothetical protein
MMLDTSELRGRGLSYNRRLSVGRLAQLGERRVRNAEVGSSSLLPSTSFPWQFLQIRQLCILHPPPPVVVTGL